MRLDSIIALLGAAWLPSTASAAARWQRRGEQLVAVQFPTVNATSALLSLSVASQSVSLGTTHQQATEDDPTAARSAEQPLSQKSSEDQSMMIDSSTFKSKTFATQAPSAPPAPTSGPPPPTSLEVPAVNMTSLLDNSSQPWTRTPTYSIYTPTLTSPTSSETSNCTMITPFSPITSYLVIHTSTVTYTGNMSDYTPPYEPISTPVYCDPYHPGRTFQPPGASSGYLKGSPVPPKGTYASTRSLSGTTSVVTFVTTAKNPSVVYPSDSPPNYSQTWIPHDGNGSGGSHDPPADQHRGSVDYTMTYGRDGVTIDDKTWTNLQPSQTTTVTVDDATFTIEPTAIHGEGVTVYKPPPAGTGVAIASPTTTRLNGHNVIVSGTEATIDGTSFEISYGGTVATVQGDGVSVGPGTVIVGGQSVTFDVKAPQRTDVVIAGGEMITAIGPTILVIHSTTYTYGPDRPVTTEVIDDDTITIGPSAVVVHNATLGGLEAAATDKTYEIVGGATITEVGTSLAVIDGTTFTVGPGASTTIKVHGGETMTIGPDGVVVASATFSYPFDPLSVTTIAPSGTWADPQPTETGAADGTHEGGEDDDDSAGVSLRVGKMGWECFWICIATGVYWVMM